MPAARLPAQVAATSVDAIPAKTDLTRTAEKNQAAPSPVRTAARNAASVDDNRLAPSPGLVAATPLRSPAAAAVGPSFTVNTLDDGADATLNGTCATAKRKCTLRAALMESNRLDDTNAIGFTKQVKGTILLSSPLADVVYPVTLTAPVDTASRPTIRVAPASVAIMPDAAAGLRITGGGSVVRGLAITGFPRVGIELAGGSGSRIEGCFIGTDVTGTVAQPNGARGGGAGGGIRVENSAANVIGGLLPGTRNVISGNATRGVVLGGATTRGNKVQGNYVGVDATGTKALGNGSWGILLSTTADAAEAASSNLVGGVEPGARNVVGGNGRSGIEVVLGADNSVLNNLVGVLPNGATAPNATLTDTPTTASAGIRVEAAPRTIIGTAPAGNIVSGNASDGVQIWGLASSDSVVQGNRIGTDAGGTVAVANTNAGLLLGGIVGSGGPTGVRIGGSATGEGNLISGNGGDGISVFDSTGTVIRGNRVGVNNAGTAAVSNRAVGILIGAGAKDTVIGGAAGADRNVVSGNATGGIAIGGSGNTSTAVRANLVGTNLGGTSALPNANFGISVNGLGVTTAPPRDTLIEGTPAAPLVVSGNTGPGVWVVAASDTIVRGTRVGTTQDGVGQVANRGDGVRVQSAPGTVVGDPGNGNVIAGNTNNGVGILSSSGGLVKGNRIGVNISGQPLANGTHGVMVDSSTVIVGSGPADAPLSTCTDACNVIAHNARDGVLVFGDTARVTVRGNSIFRNTDLGIDVWKDDAIGRTSKLDFRDSDSGPNERINFPVAVLASTEPVNRYYANPGRQIVSGVVSTPGVAGLLVDIYGIDAADIAPGLATNYDEGRRYLGSVTPRDDGSFRLLLPPGDASSSFSATVTDAAGNTSEFSASCVGLSPGASPDADGDALCDQWEARGLDYDGDGSSDLDLPSRGANPQRRTVFVEVDYFPGFKPRRQGLLDVMDAFAVSPGGNPDGTTGIDLRLNTDVFQPAGGPVVSEEIAAADAVVDMTGPAWEKIRYGDPTNPCDGSIGPPAERDGSAGCWARLEARGLVYRYSLFANLLDTAKPYAGIGELGGDSFIVAMGAVKPSSIPLLGGACVPAACRSFVEAATFMHELGHVLGLGHGGGDDENYKPNFLSVMNYGLTYRQVQATRPLDFSRSQLPKLDENSLSEPGGALNGAALPPGLPWPGTVRSEFTGVDCAAVALPFGPADWDPGDGMVGTNPAAQANINDAEGLDCGDPTKRIALVGHDDWANLDLAGRYQDYPFSWETLLATVPHEPDTDVLARQAFDADSDQDGIVNAEDVCPARADPDQADSNSDGFGDACLQDVTERDLELTGESDGLTASVSVTSHVTYTLRNPYPVDATDVTVEIRPTLGLILGSPDASAGSYSPGSPARWVMPSVPADGAVTLEFDVGTNGSVERGSIDAEIMAAGEPDVDSEPGNGSIHEDDLATVGINAEASEWDAAADFALAPGQHNNVGDRWTYSTARFEDDLASFRLMPFFTTDVCPASPVDGVNAWSGASSLCYPFIGATRGSIEDGVVFAHPDVPLTARTMPVLSWRSPFTGTAQISGYVEDIDLGGGDGISFWLRHNGSSLGATNLTFSTPRKYLATLTPAPGTKDVQVVAGDFIHLVIDPNQSRDFDSTAISMHISRVP